MVVLGCGGLGLIALSTLRALGIERVIACDVDDGKLAAARGAGARETVNSRDGQAAIAQIQKLSGGAVAGALDFVGMPATANVGDRRARERRPLHPVRPLRRRGHSPAAADRAARDRDHRLVRRDAPGAARSGRAWRKAGKLKPTPVETRPIREVNRTLDELKAGKILGRVVLDVNETA